MINLNETPLFRNFLVDFIKQVVEIDYLDFYIEEELSLQSFSYDMQEKDSCVIELKRKCNWKEGIYGNCISTNKGLFLIYIYENILKIEITDYEKVPFINELRYAFNKSLVLSCLVDIDTHAEYFTGLNIENVTYNCPDF